MIHIITGPPCAGKSTYVKENAKAGDLRVDYDLIAQALGAENSHAAEGLVKQAAFDAREGAIATALKDPKAESWIIHTTPSEDHLKLYADAGADMVELDPGYEVCMERAIADGRPQQTIDGIEKYYSGKNLMIIFPDQYGEAKEESMTFTSAQHQEESSIYATILRGIEKLRK